MMIVRLFLLTALVACGTPAQPPALPAKPTRYEIASEDVTLTVGTRSVPGTIVIPKGAGPFPGLVLLAGSGPTDRDWNSVLLPSKNGSAKLLAEALASRGVVVLRFDKAGSGKNPGPALADWTIDTYSDEGLAALSLVRSRPDVRKDRVFLAGHSEGGIHATRVALAARTSVAGVLYLSSAARSMAETMMTQLENQLANAAKTNPLAGISEADVVAQMDLLRHAFDDFYAGRTVDPKAVSKLPPIQQLVAQVMNPATAALSRTLLGFDNAKQAPTLKVPVFVLGGGKDVQVDPEIDTRYLDRSLRATNKDVTLHIAPDADHVLKHETKTVAQLRADLVTVQNRYNADDRILDEDAVRAITEWLAAHTR
jgi:pimeloyl-ACP methyl ester carboxylesterase